MDGLAGGGGRRIPRASLLAALTLSDTKPQPTRPRKFIAFSAAVMVPAYAAS
jgi:hypothetical protein